MERKTLPGASVLHSLRPLSNTTPSLCQLPQDKSRAASFATDHSLPLDVQHVYVPPRNAGMAVTAGPLPWIQTVLAV